MTLKEKEFNVLWPTTADARNSMEIMEIDADGDGFSQPLKYEP